MFSISDLNLKKKMKKIMMRDFKFNALQQF